MLIEYSHGSDVTVKSVRPLECVLVLRTRCSFGMFCTAPGTLLPGRTPPKNRCNQHKKYNFFLMPRKPQNPSLADTDAAPGGVAAVDRALSLINAFHRNDPPLSLTELAERTRLYKSTVSRLLASLEHAHFVQRIQAGPYRGHWALGSAVARLYSVYTTSASPEAILVPTLEALVKETGESAAYHVRQGDARLCLYRVDSPHPLRDHTQAGDLLPMDRGAGARVLIAFGEDPGSPLYQKDRDLYEQIKKQGYCANVGDRVAEIAGISAPVFKADGSLAGAITLSMPANRFNQQHIEPVVRAARLLSGTF